MRKKKIERGDTDEDNVPATELAENLSMYALLAEEERKKFRNDALEILDQEGRFLIIMYYYEDRELNELSAITGLSRSNIKVRLFRSRKKMLAYL